MANVLASLLVELGMNTAAFTKGADKATYSAKVMGKQIQSSFSAMGNTVSSMLSQFGPLGNVAGQAFDRMGKGAAAVTGKMNSMGPMMVALGAAGGAAAGGILAAGAGAITLALNSSKAAGELYDLSQRLGVSVETLSRYGYVAKQSGIDTQAMNTALQQLNKNAFSAATATDKSMNAFKRLGIAVKASDGSLRPVESLMGDIADKFKLMGNTGERTALAMQIFGKSGAQMLPFLNEGRDGIAKLTAEADRLGVTISTETAAAADRFGDQMDRLKSAAGGFSNKVMEALLPMMNTFADSMVDGVMASDGFKRGVDLMVLSVKVLGTAIAAAWGTMRLFIEAALEGGAAATYWKDVVVSGFADAQKKFNATKDALGISLKDTFLSSVETIQNIWKPANLEAAKAVEQHGDAVDVLRGKVTKLSDAYFRMPKPKDKIAPFAGPPSLLGGNAPLMPPSPEAVGATYDFSSIDPSLGEKQSRAYAEVLRDEAKALREDLLPPKMKVAIEQEKYNIMVKEGLITQTEANAATEKYALAVGAVAKKLADTEAVVVVVKESLNDMFTQAIFRAGSFKDALNNVLNRITEVIFQTQIMNRLLGAPGGKGGGLLDKVVGFASGLFSGSVGGVAQSDLLSLNNLNGALPIAGYRANGGDVMPGRNYIVGEKGPEVLKMGRTGGTVAANGGDTHVTNHFHLNGVTDADSFKKSSNQIGSALGAAVQRAQQRNR